ncbi:MAG: hypothetical protein NVV59_08440 [Chitinophagaceae bacterium]|nr:hypothetical protein [Chitinophagaceae bacterium]
MPETVVPIPEQIRKKEKSNPGDGCGFDVENSKLPVEPCKKEIEQTSGEKITQSLGNTYIQVGDDLVKVKIFSFFLFLH